MTVYWRDSFGRANQPGFGTADSGGTYSVVRGNQALSIASNEGLMAFVNTTTAGVVQAGSQQIGDSEMLCRVSQGGSTTDLVGVVPRFIDSNDWYCFVIGDTAGQFQLIKDVAGTFTVVKSFAFTTTVGSFYWIRSRVQSTHFLGKIWADGSPEPNVWGIDTTDSSLTANGTFGLTCAPQSGNNVKVDSLYVIDYLNSEALVVSDSFAGLVTSSPTEVLSASDNQAITSAASPSELLSISDSSAAASSYAATEALSIADQSSALAGASLVESLALASQSSASMAASWAEGLAASSQGGNAGSMSVSEALILSDSFGDITLFAPIDALIAVDQFSVGLAVLWIEGLSIVDSFTGISSAPVIGAPPLINATMLARKGTVTLDTRKGNITMIARKGNVTLYGRKN